MANTESTQVTGPSRPSSDMTASNTTSTSRPRVPNHFFRRVPPFSVQRLKAMSDKNSTTTQPVSIKQDHTVDLRRMSLSELNELLKKQNKLIQNRQLLSKLKDNGEKMIAFRDKIAVTIKLREDMNDTEMMLNRLTLNSVDNVQSEHDHRIQILQKPPCVATQARFNVPRKMNSTVKVTDLKSRDFKEVKVKLELPKEIKTLNLDESLKTLEMTSRKNKSALADQILRFYSRRIEDDSDSDSEFDEKGDLSDGENDFSEDDDADLHVNVTLAQ